MPVKASARCRSFCRGAGHRGSVVRNAASCRCGVGKPAAPGRQATVTHTSLGCCAQDLVDSHFRLSLLQTEAAPTPPTSSAAAAAAAVADVASGAVGGRTKTDGARRRSQQISCQGNARVLTMLHGSAEDLINMHFRLSLGRRWPLALADDRRKGASSSSSKPTAATASSPSSSSSSASGGGRAACERRSRGRSPPPTAAATARAAKLTAARCRAGDDRKRLSA